MNKIGVRPKGSGRKHGVHPLLWKEVSIEWVDGAPVGFDAPTYRVAWVGDPLGIKPIGADGEEGDRVWVPLGGIEMIVEVE